MKKRQCKKCPWRQDVDPHDIPNGYCETKHAALKDTIAQPGALNLGGRLRLMACHESPIGKERPCVGWLANQLGPGNKHRAAPRGHAWSSGRRLRVGRRAARALRGHAAVRRGKPAPKIPRREIARVYGDPLGVGWERYRAVLADLVRQEREYRGWEQADLARAADISRGVVSRIETGRDTMVPLMRIYQLAKAFGFRDVKALLP